MKEYIKMLESIKQQFESALDDGQNSTDIDAIEAVEDNTLTVEALNMATQALVDFPAMLNQYLGENDQMIIGKDVYEELKYEKDRLEAFMRGLWEEHCMGDETYTTKEVFDMINREVFDKGGMNNDRKM